MRQIEAFRAAMEFGSATAAGEVLHITQPAVSRLLADLESNVGFQLFERRARGLVPTQDAHSLYDEVRRSFIGLDRIGQVATGIREKATGTVRVIALSKYADGFVASIIGQFISDNPGIMVELESSGTAGVVEGISSQSYDVGIASATVSDNLIQAEPLFETTVMLAMGISDPLANQEVVSLRALDGRRMVVLPEDSEYGSVIWRALRKEKVNPIVVGEARTHASLCKMVEAGAGITLVDRTTASDFSSDNIVFRATYPAVTRKVATIINTRVAQSIATKSFLSTLRDNVRNT
ncbi:MAG: LysR substrate-binding domain-containing protein [Pseudomonadota bacterium]|nr:LysR substrate-binding domain-containing protein [Pseudomonadota bacterium]